MREIIIRKFSMTKILRNAPWLFLYVVLLHTNIAAMDPYLAILRQNQSFVKAKCHEDYLRKKPLRNGDFHDSQQSTAAAIDYFFFNHLIDIFEDEVAQGHSANAAAERTLVWLGRALDGPLSHTVKEDISLCLGDAFKTTQS
jgi:hypothetical protein